MQDKDKNENANLTDPENETAGTAEETAAVEENETAAEESAVTETGITETAEKVEEKKEETENLLNKWLPPAVGYGSFFGALVLAIGIGLLVCLL